ncbi:nucleotide exchange factor GrpE [Mycoplasmopsis columbinasalis]|uniref:Protein GrpE n=1 Tax=Mycoplasmopsis columbinasalis TaxID=114880 RepID=A0A449BA69_9BACT|nr:nucleotide exchange factor GrpE [Mycoplasmopsis columbinasalis]VEU78055.1 heat shock protein [Mycoplasmopsis columbinasalis]
MAVRFVFQKGDMLQVNIKAFDQHKKPVERFCAKKMDIVLVPEVINPQFSFLVDALIGLPTKGIFEFDYNVKSSQQEKNDKKPEKPVHPEKQESIPLHFQVEVINYQPFQTTHAQSRMLEYKKQYEAREKTIELQDKQIKHLESQLKQAVADIKKAKEAKVVERFVVPKEEIEKAQRYALQKFIEDFVAPYGTLKMAIAAGEKSESTEVKNYLFGFNMVLNMLKNTLENNGVFEFTPDLNTEFNPETSKIIEQLEDFDQPNNTVIKVTQSGFRLYDRVIKPALVIATKNPNAFQQSSDEESNDTDVNENNDATQSE